MGVDPNARVEAVDDGAAEFYADWNDVADADEPADAAAAIRRALLELPVAKRLDVLRSFCRGCGRADPLCECWREE